VRLILGDFVHQHEVSPTIDRSYDDLCEELDGIQNRYVILGDARSGDTRRLMANPSLLSSLRAFEKRAGRVALLWGIHTSYVAERQGLDEYGSIPTKEKAPF
jgi:hypothetical protein